MLEQDRLCKGITFGSGDRCLQGKVYRGGGGAFPGAALLFIHGLGSGQAGYASRARETSQALGIQCYTFDLSGHGEDKENFRRYSVHEHLEDAVAAYDYIAAQSTTNPARIGACGASYGAYLAALMSGHRPVKRLLLRAPALASDIEIPPPYQSYTQDKNPEIFDSLSALSRHVGHVLIVESGRDCRIPHSNIVAYLNACRHPEHAVIPEAGHTLTEPAWNLTFVQIIKRWFSSL
jgi:uncharacterized protein